MQTNSRIFDDLAKLASGALGTAQGMKSEWENLFHQRIERLISNMDLVPREEFDAVKAMVVSLTEQAETQTARIAALEKQLSTKPTAGKPRKKATTGNSKQTSSNKAD
ncbi:MAG: accessory factor UbiK family protein [Sneathiella sp.]|nr:accessory factor UbiK family protein [Sneathiella sp.]